MNRPLKPPTEMAASMPALDIDAVVRNIGKENGEQNIAEEIRAEFRRQFPLMSVLPLIVEDIKKRIEGLVAKRQRHDKAQEEADLVTPQSLGPRSEPLSRYDSILFLLFNFGAVIGVAMAMHALASYIADSGVISLLDGRYYASLLMSAVPLTSVLAIKSRAAMAGSDKAERTFYRRLFQFGVVALVVHLVVVSLVFAPQKVDLSSIQQALADGVSPSNWFTAVVKNIGERTVLGSQLFAETLLSPIIAYKADLILRAGRKVVVQLSETQVVHEEAIKSINSEIDSLILEQARDQTELAALSAAERSRIEAAQARYRDLSAELDANLKRARDEFFSKRQKGDNR